MHYTTTDRFRTFGIRSWMLLLLTMLCAHFSSRAQCDFVDVAPSQNIYHTFTDGALGGGVSFMDFDGDGWDDLTLGTSKGEPVRFYKNNEGQFEIVTLEGIDNTCETKQITWVDFDNDGDKDLYYGCEEGGVVLYQNDGNLSFTEITTEFGLVLPDALTFGANWADFDKDGWLDLYITYYGGLRNQLFRNLAGNGFENISVNSGVDPVHRPSFCAVVFDYDQDGFEDIYVANDRSTRNDLLKNLDGSSFEEVGAASMSNLPMDAMGTTILDMNQDGFFEIYISNSPQGNALLFNNGDGTFKDIAQESGTIFNSVGWGVNTLDFDNDACHDLYVSSSEDGKNYSSSVLYRALDESSFEQTQYPGMAADTMISFSNAVGDFNRDGKMDIAVNNSYGNPSQLWQNNCINDNHWLKLQLEGTISNRDAIGAHAVVYTDGLPNHQYKTAGISFMAQNTDYLHFGLATSTAVDSVLVFWPSGVIDKLLNPGIDQLITLEEGAAATPVAITASHSLEALCEGEEITLSVNLKGREHEVQWSDNTTGNELIVSETGVYSASVKFGNQNITSENKAVNFNNLPGVTYEITDASNDGTGSITLHPDSESYSYSWSHDLELNGPVADNLSPGMYVVRITSEQGCNVNLTLEVKANIITSLDDPVKNAIGYRMQANQLIISLPPELRGKLQEVQVLNAHGQSYSTSEFGPLQAAELAIADIPYRQLIIVQLQFSDGRHVKKLFFED